jgi:hypothetical protein
MDVLVLNAVVSGARVNKDAGNLAVAGLSSFRREHPESHAGG